MKRRYNTKICIAFAILLGCLGLKAQTQNQDNNQPKKQSLDIDSIDQDKVIDEVIWVVGDEAILKSDVEAMRAQSEVENIKFKGNPDCAIPEQLAVQKLFLHQAAIDSLEVTESEISTGIEYQINYCIQLNGSKEKLEEYKKQTVSQMRSQMHDEFNARQMIQQLMYVPILKIYPKTVSLLYLQKWKYRSLRGHQE